MNGSIFQNFPKFEPKFWKSGDFAQNLAENWSNWYMNESLVFEKLVFVWVYFQILWRRIPTKTELEYPLGAEVGKTNKQKIINIFVL